jgi:predicted nucleotidyltransferase
MPRLEPALLTVVADLARGLRTLGVPFAVVGALVPELLLDVRPARMTNDADVTVTVESLAEFETLKDRLADFGFARTRAAHRLLHHSGGRVDLLPFGPELVHDGRLELEADLLLNMAGFDHVVPSAVQVSVDNGLTLPVAPLPLFVLLKLVAFSDRKAPKDLAGVFHCLRYYLEDDERRYEVEHDGAGVLFEYAGAYLVGIDGRRFLSTAPSQAVATVLDLFADADSEGVAIVTREQGRFVLEQEELDDVFQYFHWYRRGLDRRQLLSLAMSPP